jgi:hypothetical protein
MSLLSRPSALQLPRDIPLDAGFLYGKDATLRQITTGTISISLKSSLISLCHVHSEYQNDSFPSTFAPKLWTHLSPLPMHAICLAHLKVLHLTVIIISVRSTNHELPHYVIFSILLLLLSLRSTQSAQHLLPKYPQCSSLNARNQVLHPHKTDKITFLCVLNRKSLDSKL